MSKSKEEILEELLSYIDNKYDKRVGTLFYDFLAAVSIEKEALYKKIEILESKLDITNLSGEEVDRYIEQNSDQLRRAASFATCELFVNGNGVINIGDLFETKAGIQFEAIKLKNIVESGLIEVQSVLQGEVGNIIANTITQIPVTIPGIISVTNIVGASGGYEAETDGEFIDRFLDMQQDEVTQGNIAAYKKWCLEVVGVGGCKVFPLENLNGEIAENSLLIIIVDTNKLPADATLVSATQLFINPLDKNGHGEGVAPIGAYVYVKSATPLNLNINFTANYKVGYTKKIVEPLLRTNLETYLKSIAFIENNISYAKIGNVVLNTEGIEDYTNLFINDQANNVPILEKEVTVLGVITID
ncbi:baseplate J/gp47 family protein [Helicovermis profundi]|uniref:Baseplate J/gp47 family protein n=1 Tax=Helicovermis profundi TaxID=3065157 RepID=A0AAU9E815_9FIRM|nr:baseplate J/gp47 family protein [Clostridia bacterium S502]